VYFNIYEDQNMSTEPNATASVNPLSKFFRTPAIYFSLPSGGKWWPEGSLDLPESNEIAVYPMTNKDEILIRTPDALINGQGVTEVIQSCIPSIKDAWKMPATDVDAALIAMRIASYGHKMDFSNQCPHCREEHDYALDLRHMLETITAPDYGNKDLDLEVIKIKFRPQKYWEVNHSNKTAFEVRKLQLALANLPDSEEDEEKTHAVTEQLRRVNTINHNIMAKSTEYVEIVESGQRVDNPDQIQEFYGQIGRDMFDKIQDEITKIQKEGSVKPVSVNCLSCEKPMEITILFDYANFFVVGS
jgi:hypothetical protein